MYIIFLSGLNVWWDYSQWARDLKQTPRNGDGTEIRKGSQIPREFDMQQKSTTNPERGRLWGWSETFPPIYSFITQWMVIEIVQSPSSVLWIAWVLSVIVIFSWYGTPDIVIPKTYRWCIFHNVEWLLMRQVFSIFQVLVLFWRYWEHCDVSMIGCRVWSIWYQKIWCFSATYA